MFFFFFFSTFIYFWERGRQRETEHDCGRSRERGRHRIQNRLQALSHQPRAWCGARTHGLRDRDLAEVGRLTDCATQAPRDVLFEWSSKALVRVTIFRCHIPCLTLMSHRNSFQFGKHLFRTNYILRTVLVWCVGRVCSLKTGVCFIVSLLELSKGCILRKFPHETT